MGKYWDPAQQRWIETDKKTATAESAAMAKEKYTGGAGLGKIAKETKEMRAKDQADALATPKKKKQKMVMVGGKLKLVDAED
jgi:hypothetical protein